MRSIYEGDDCFKEVSSTVFHFRVGNSGEPKAFLIELTWPESYPQCIPLISLGSFFNVHLSKETKDLILDRLTEQAEAMLGSPMTYSLFEFIRESAEDLVVVDEKPSEDFVQTKKKEKKLMLSKQAKRRLADRTDAKGELPRGWNWVDVIGHLSKTGGN